MATAAPLNSSPHKYDHLLDTAHLHADLKGRTVRGGAVTLAAQGIKFALNLGQTVVLARLLAPADFGLVAMVTAVTGFVAMFKDAGLSMATVQRDKITHDQVSTLFWINVGLSAILAAIVVALAPVLSWFYGDPRLTAITLAIAGTFIFSGLTIQHQALLRRQMRFTVLATIEIVSMAAGITVAIILAAVAHVGYWALVWMAIVQTVVNCIMVWFLSPWRPGLPRKGSGVRPMLAFGGNLTGFNFVIYFSRCADNILIGWMWGAGQLGLYSKAYSLLMLPLSQITFPLSGVALPALSRLQNNPQEFKNYYFRAINVMMWIIGPCVAFVAACSEPIIILTLGPRWIGADMIFKLLAVTAFFQPIYATNSWIFTSLNQTHRQLKFGIVTSTVFVFSFIVGLPFGAAGVAASYATAFFLLIPWMLYYIFRFSPIAYRDLFNVVKYPTLVGMTIFILATIAQMSIPDGKYLQSIGVSLFILFLSSPLLLISSLRNDLKSAISLVSFFRKEHIMNK